MKSTPLAQQKCSGHGKGGRGFLLTYFQSGVSVQSALTVCIPFGYQDSIAALAYDKGRLMALINCIHQGKKFCPCFG